ncbi:MAG: diaminopropionate ammonia-lyase [Oscillospiraceae bacterium]
MQNDFKLVEYERKGSSPCDTKFLGEEAATAALKFHSSIDGYQPTPLVSLDALAAHLGIGGIYLKDESYRFGLNAFKVLGGSYAIASYIAKRLGEPLEQLPFSRMISPQVKEKLGEITFITATDGNHGRGVAWTAHKLQQNSVVYMPKGSAAERLANIQALGAKASITDVNYDAAVAMANADAEKNGWVMVQDTAWDGYEDIPKWIMQGYTTMALEAHRQLEGVKPTHIFLQAGVGSFAGAITGFFADIYGAERPIITIVEPNKADCIFLSAQANDGTRHFVTDDMSTIMAGLACGEPNTISWEVLKSCCDFFISCPDFVAAKGMRVLGSPTGQDTRVISGESGAVTAGLVAAIMENPDLAQLKEKLKLNKNSRVLLFSTEGDTDKENYRKILWDGLYPSY